MNNIGRIVLCAVLIVALGAPALAAGDAKKSNSLSTVTGTIYKGGATVIDTAEGVCTGCLKRTFVFFNPCIDLFKVCTNVVLSPIEKPFSYVEKTLFKPKTSGAPNAPAPKKPEIPK